ncbi:hypothetical protein BHYA_0035g00410 [Botrytis hyacinthi]|uniref:Uncharacterized protein n=1 Tax=Botrytis hyacinthi TaxID=278943 RepID=A0A4Z1H5U1_9HELO|nr:hypothetical protein BHYA_0035g00410 [Botrytis hyacinthi]
MPTSFQSRDAGAQTVEDIFFDAPEELYEDALENQEVDYVEPAPFHVNDPEYEMLMVIEECLINVQEHYEKKMKKEDHRFSHVMALYDKFTNRPLDPSKMGTPEALRKERKLYTRCLNESTRYQKLLDREYLVGFNELKMEAGDIMDKWNSKQISLAAVPHKLVVEEHARWTLLRQKQMEFVHDKTKDLVNEQANRIRELEYALSVAQQRPAATPYFYHETSGMTQAEVMAGAYQMMYQQQVNHGVQNVVQPSAYLAQSDNIAVLNGQEQVSAGENFAQAQQLHDSQNPGNPDLFADSGEIEPPTIADDQQETLNKTNIHQAGQGWNVQQSESSTLVANSEKSDDDAISESRAEIIEEGEIVEVEHPVNFQKQEIPEPDKNLPKDQSNFVTPNGQEEPIATGINISQGEEQVNDNTQEVQQPENHLPTPPLDAAVPIIPNQQMRQNSYVNYMEDEEDPGRMYPVHSSDPIKKAWARKKLDLDFDKKKRDTVDEIMQTGRKEAAMEKWAETVSGLLQEVSPRDRAAEQNIQDFDEDEKSDDEYGRKRIFGTYEEDDEFEEERNRKRVRPIASIPIRTAANSLIFEPTPDDSPDQEVWEEPATGYIGHDGVYYDPDGRRQHTQADAGQEYSGHNVDDGGHPVPQYTPPPPQQQNPSPPSAPASRIRSYASRFFATRRNDPAPARHSRQRMLRTQVTRISSQRYTMAELAECPKPSFWAVFMGLAEQAVCDPSEFSNKEIAKTVASLSIESTMSPLPFELSQIITMVLGFMVLMQSSLLTSPSNIMWLMKSVVSIMYEFILKPHITLYKLVGPAKLLYLALDTFFIFLFIVFYFLYRGSVAGLGCVVNTYQPREAQTIAGITNISPDCELKECTIYLSAWCNKPLNMNAMVINLIRKSEGVELEFADRDECRILEGNRKIMVRRTGFIIRSKEMVRDLRARIRWTHAALLLLLVLIIQIPAVSKNTQLIPGIILQCPGWAAGVFLTCYRYMEAAVITKARLVPGIFDYCLVAVKEVLLSGYQYLREAFLEATASFRNFDYEGMNEKLRKQRKSEAMRAVEVGDGYEVVYDSKQAFITRFQNVNKIVRDNLFNLLWVWFLYSFMPYILHLLKERIRGAAERRRAERP